MRFCCTPWAAMAPFPDRDCTRNGLGRHARRRHCCAGVGGTAVSVAAAVGGAGVSVAAAVGGAGVSLAVGGIDVLVAGGGTGVLVGPGVAVSGTLVGGAASTTCCHASG